MRILILIILSIFTLPLMATNYYVKTGGSDAAAGTSDGAAWATITKVNASTFSAGDSIFFNRGNRFEGNLIVPSSGTSESYIVIGAYGTGARPIITPNTYMDSIWIEHGDNIWKTVLGINPGNMLLDSDTLIFKLNDYWMSATPADGRYDNLQAMDLMALTDTDSFTIATMAAKVSFWDGIDALYCYANDTTYIRFRDNSDPNDKNLAISADGSKAIYVYNKQYIKFENLNIVGGARGIDLYTIVNDDTDNIIIENCYIESSDKKIYIHHGPSTGIIVRNDTITNNHLSTFRPGAWVNGTDYTHVVACHYYEFAKYRRAVSESTDVDQGISSGQSLNHNIVMNDNVIIDCINGLSMGAGSTNKAYGNYIEGSSSVAIHFGAGTLDAEAYDNYIVNSNIPFRFQNIDDVTYDPRTNYVYRNRVYIPDAGQFMYIHSGNVTQISTTTAYIYHNSIICKTGITISSYLLNYAAGSGFVFVNNIVSASWNNTGQYSGMATKDDLFEYYYNWTGGTFYGAGALPGAISLWATDTTNLNYVGETFWTHATDPPDYTDIVGTEVINTGINLSDSFSLGGIDYAAMPGLTSYYDNTGTVDMGYYQIDDGEPITPPNVATSTITKLTPYTASARVHITYAGGGEVSQSGVCWSTSEDPTTSDSKTEEGAKTGIFTTTITGLLKDTTYYVRAYATNEGGTSYGENVVYSTPAVIRVKDGTTFQKWNGQFIDW